MSRCGCSGSTCSCVLRGAGATTVRGSGTINSPYVVDTRLYLAGGTSGNIALTVSGQGSIGEPYVINASQELLLDDLADVSASGGSTGDVLAKNAAGGWAPVPPVTAPVGAIASDDSLHGDGSSGIPLGVTVASGGGISVTPTGLAVDAFQDYQTFTPEVQLSTGGILTMDPGSSISGRYAQVGKTVYVRIVWIASRNIPVGESGYYSITLPVAAHGDNDESQYLMARLLHGDGAADSVMGQGIITGGSRVRLINIHALNDTTRTLGPGYPTWGSKTYRLNLHGFYEAA